MPVFIDEVVAEVVQQVTAPEEAESSAHQFPMSAAEIDLARTLALIQERQDRLRVD